MLLEIVKVALGALRANKLRSFLTMLGVVIGVGSVIAMVAIGRGAQKQIEERIAALGTTMLSITPGQQRAAGGGVTTAAAITLDDATALRNETKYLENVLPVVSVTKTISFGSKNASLEIAGATSNYMEVRKGTITLGRMFTDAEDRAGRRVAVIGSQVGEDMGLPASDVLINQMVRIGGLQFEVIGIAAPQGSVDVGKTLDEKVLIPVTTQRYKVAGTTRVTTMTVMAVSEERIPDATAETQRILRRQHRLTPGKPDDFTIRNQADILQTAAESSQTFTALLAGVAGVSLLVGGIGIMNIMLVSVTERTREIGVRKALGATKWAILSQFLIEAVVLCLLGGGVGILAGAGGAIGSAAALGFTPSVSPGAVMGAFAFSAAIGIIFGVWPARRAAALDPIAALRYE